MSLQRGYMSRHSGNVGCCDPREGTKSVGSSYRDCTVLKICFWFAKNDRDMRKSRSRSCGWDVRWS